MEKELVQEFVQVMLKLFSKELSRKKFAQYKSAKVVSINTNGSVNIKIPPSETIIHNILNKTGETLSENDDVSLLLKDGTMSTALVAFKNKTNLIYNGSSGGSSLTEDILNRINSAIQAIKVNNTLLNPNSNQEVNINVPTKLTHLTNDGHFVQDINYIHTDNNLTNSLLDKINSSIQGIKVNDTLLSLNNNQEVNIAVPTNLTELINDGYFVQDQYYTHTDNNLTNTLKKSYDNLVTNVNQTVNSNNKLATINDIPTIDLSNYYNKEETNNRYVQKETGKGLSTNDFTNAEKTKLAGISINANKVEKSNINGNIKIDGVETMVYSLTQSEIISVLGFMPSEGGTVDLSDYYDKGESDNRYAKKEDVPSKVSELNNDKNYISTTELFEKIYPVGAIYISANSVNPSTLFGGTWEQIKDKFLLSAGTTYDMGDTGGNSSITLSTNQLPSHNHEIPSLSGTTESEGSHSHTWSMTNCETAGNHGHGGLSIDGVPVSVTNGSQGNGYGVPIEGNKRYGELWTSNAGNHKHSISGKNESNGSHTHSVTTISNTTGTKGNGESIKIMPPYLVVYVWKRTA